MIDRKRLLADLDHFARAAPKRLAGSPDEERAFAYAREQLEAAGWDVWSETFTTLRSRVHATTVLLEDGGPLSAMGIGYATKRGAGRWLDLVDVGDGGWDSYEGVDAGGKAVLVSSDGPSVPDKSFIAQRRGAVALILISPASPVPTLALRAQKGVWGPPQPEDLIDLPDVTAVSVLHRDGQGLRDRLRAHNRVRVRLEGAADTAWSAMRQLVARLGPEDSEFLLLHGHVDAWSPGVTDNATGLAALLETARALAAGPALPRAVWLALWSGHEVEEASGSAAFVDRHWNDLRRCALHLNVDSPGCLDGENVILYRSLELRSAALGALERLGIPVVRELPLAKESDNSFALAGVPGIGVVPAGEQRRTEDGVDVGPLWWMHTDQDDLGKVQRDLLARDADALLELVRSLGAAPRIHDFHPVRTLLASVLERLGDQGLATLWAKASEVLAHPPGGAQARRISRLLLGTVGTRGGRLRHDRYGDPLYAYEYPGIAHLLGRAAEEHALASSRLRERNHLEDLLYALASLEALPDGL